MTRKQIVVEPKTFETLVRGIVEVHRRLADQTAKAVNIGLTLRNWLIGRYIQEYERMGEDRARYGVHLIEKLATRLERDLDRCYTERYLRLCRQLYEDYPQIGKSLISESQAMTFRKSLISALSAEALEPLPRRRMRPYVQVERLIESLSFTHFIELIKLSDPLKRAFYEVECISGNWSVRELKRQISSLYYERLGLSKNKKKLEAMVT